MYHDMLILLSAELCFICHWHLYLPAQYNQPVAVPASTRESLCSTGSKMYIMHLSLSFQLSA